MIVECVIDVKELERINLCDEDKIILCTIPPGATILPGLNGTPFRLCADGKVCIRYSVEDPDPATITISLGAKQQ